MRRSFALIEPIAPQAAALFYNNLFTADPSLRRLFQGNTAQQGTRLNCPRRLTVIPARAQPGLS